MVREDRRIVFYELQPVQSSYFDNDKFSLYEPLVYRANDPETKEL